MEEGAGARKGELVTEAGHRHRHRHTRRGLNAYLLANLKDRFLKKTNKKRQNKKRNKKNQQDGVWISRWGVGFIGSRVTPPVEEPLSETRVPDTRSAHAPPRSLAPTFPGYKGARLVATPAAS